LLKKNAENNKVVALKINSKRSHAEAALSRKRMDDTEQRRAVPNVTPSHHPTAHHPLKGVEVNHKRTGNLSALSSLFVKMASNFANENARLCAHSAGMDSRRSSTENVPADTRSRSSSLKLAPSSSATEYDASIWRTLSASDLPASPPSTSGLSTLL
jgi:hypothetical protein